MSELKDRMSKPKPIVNAALVAVQIKLDIAQGLIADKVELVEKILSIDDKICRQSGYVKRYKKNTIDKSSLSRFLLKFDIPKPSQLCKISKEGPACSTANVFSVDDDFSTLAPDPENTVLERNIDTKAIPLSSCFESFLSEAVPLIEDNNKSNVIIKYQGEKIKELTKICSGLCNKIPPSSSFLLGNPVFSEEGDRLFGSNNRTLQLCIGAIIQVLSPIKRITEWIVENDFLIIQGLTPDDPFQQLANSWFWDGILKFEAAGSSERVAIIEKFGHNIKDLCERHDNVFGTQFSCAKGDRQGLFIPPSPLDILSMISEQHYNHFIDLLPTNGCGRVVYDLPNLPFKKIQLRPPTNTKPFAHVSFCSWRPSLCSSPTILKASAAASDVVEESTNLINQDVREEADILLAELSWDRDKLPYVHFSWPQFGEKNVILEKGWKYYNNNNNDDDEDDGHQEFGTTQNDYQMTGVIWGKQFIGDWISFDGLLPHLGIDKPPVTYIFASKRDTSPDDPSQGKWYLCLDDNYGSSFRPLSLSNSFQDVLLYMDNDHRKTYRPQLLIFQKLQRRKRGVGSTLSSNPSSDVDLFLQKGGNFSPPSYEPDLQKQRITFSSSPFPSDLVNMSCCAVLLQPITSAAVIVKKKVSIKGKRLPNSNTQLTSKRQLVETIDAIVNALPLTKAADEERFFGYDKESEYQKGPSGFQITQTHDQKVYYNTLNSKKR